MPPNDSQLLGPFIGNVTAKTATIWFLSFGALMNISMHMPARLLVIALLAVGLCLPAVIGQQPGTVNIRPRVATAQPQAPTVKLLANPTTVATKSPVNFAAQLSHSYPNIQYH